MIKRYNQFVREKVNEEFETEFDLEAPVIEEPETINSEEESNINEPETDSNIENKFTEEEEEETPVDKYETALKALADAAGVEYVENSKEVVINDKKVTFPAEDEKYHIEGIRKGFTSIEDVIANAGGKSATPSIKDKEALEEPSFEETEDELAKRDLEHEMRSFESKSYKSTRLKRFK
jgi:hypothetical protein